MAERSTIYFGLALVILLVALWIEELAGVMIEGFILAAIALNLYAVFSTITKASLEVAGIKTSTAYVCSILMLFTFFIPVASWLFVRAITGTDLLKNLVVDLHVLGGLVAFYAGRRARSEWSEHNKSSFEESHTDDIHL